MAGGRGNEFQLKATKVKKHNRHIQPHAGKISCPEADIVAGGRGNEFQSKATKVNKQNPIGAVRVRLSLFSAKSVSMGLFVAFRQKFVACLFPPTSTRR